MDRSLFALLAAPLLGCAPTMAETRRSYADIERTARYAAVVPERYRPQGPFAPTEEWWRHGGYDVHLDRTVPPEDVDRPSPVAGRVCVLLVHGGGGNGRVLAPFAVLLARHGIESVAPDLPPYGLTRVPAGASPRWDEWLEIVTALAAREHARDGRPVVLFGLSIGGMTALQAAERSPVVRGTVATTLLDMREPEILRAAAADTLLARVGLALNAHFPFATANLWLPARDVAPIDLLANDPEVNRLAREDPLVGGARAPGRFWQSLARPTRFTEAEDVDKPVLLVHPGEDRWTAPTLSLRYFERVASDKQYVELSTGGHYPVEPAALAEMERAIVPFVERLAGSE